MNLFQCISPTKWLKIFHICVSSNVQCKYKSRSVLPRSLHSLSQYVHISDYMDVFQACLPLGPPGVVIC